MLHATISTQYSPVHEEYIHRQYLYIYFDCNCLVVCFIQSNSMRMNRSGPNFVGNDHSEGLWVVRI